MLSTALRKLAPTLMALALGCGPAVPDDNGWDETDFSQAELAYPGQDGEPRRAIIDVDGVATVVDLREIEGQLVLESDLILPPEMVTLLDQRDENEESVELGQSQEPLAARKQAALWPKGVVYYKLGDNLSATMKQRIKDAMAHWQNKTPIRFVAHDNQPDWVLFTTGPGCSATIGRAGGKQLVNLNSKCTKGNIIHEIGHSVGLWHEQSRTDRANHIAIRWKNIQDGQRFNFQTYVQQGFDGRNVGVYDIKSIMHYGSFAFSRNGKPTIVRLNGTTFDATRVLSDRDIAGVKKIYEPLL
jgi:hypothetical protein